MNVADAEAAKRMLDPVLICGAPRSGVRLLAAILDGHPQLASGPELPFLITLAQQWLDIDRTLGSNHEQHYRRSRDDTRSAFRSTALRLFAPHLASRGKRQMVLHSFGVALSARVFGQLFPAAQFLILVRDPRDVVCSLQQCDWRNPRTGEPLPYTRDAVAAARFWLEFNRATLQATRQLHADGRVMWLRYEDLCSRPDESLNAVARFVDITTPVAEIAAEAARRVVLSADAEHPALKVGAVHPRHVNRWRTQSVINMSAVDALTLEFRKAFGYT